MGITVREALNIGVLRRANVLGGEDGLDRIIESVTIMDTPDIANWLKGGEMLLANAYVIKDDPIAQVQLIRDLGMKRAAVLVIKLHRYIERLPEEMLKIADENQLPIIEIPIDVAWVEIISPVLSQIHVRNLKLLSYSKEVHDEFTKIVLSGGDIDDIKQTLYKLIGRANNITRIDEYNRIEEKQFIKQKIFPIKVSERIIGEIAIDITSGLLRNEDLIAIEHAATVSALTFLKEDAVNEAEIRYRNEFLSSILDHTIKDCDEILTRGRNFGWNLSGSFVILVIEVDSIKKYEQNNERIHSEKRNFFNSIIRSVKEIIGECIYLDRDNRLILFLSQNTNVHSLDNNNEIKKIAKALYKILSSQYEDINFCIGMGRLRRNILDVSESYHEAISALRLRNLVCHSERIVHFEDLTIYKLLFDHRAEQKFVLFEQEIFDGLYKLKEENRSLLLSTLQTFFKCQCNIHAAAQILMIHPNTLRYRLHKIEKLCNVQLDNNEHTLKLQVALKIAELNNRL